MIRTRHFLRRKLLKVLLPPVVLITSLTVIVSVVTTRSALQRFERVDQALAAEVARAHLYAEVTAGVMLIVVLAGLSSWLATKITRELSPLLEGIESVSRGEPSEVVSTQSQLGLDRIGSAFNAMMRRMSDDRRALEESQRAQSRLHMQLTHAQALTAVGRVAASIAHEVGSPLNTILLTARMAAEDEQCTDSQRALFERLASESDRIGVIVKRMLQLSRPYDDRPGRCNPVVVAEAMLAFLRPQLLQANIETKIERETGEASAPISTENLQQILLNLCLNAIYAQPLGGALVLAIAVRDGQTTLEVRDRGPGVDVAIREQIFEPFYSDRGEVGGTGLGLSIARDIAELAGATLTVHDAPEGGACFRVVFSRPPVASR